jgi:hypothetical protein
MGDTAEGSDSDPAARLVVGADWVAAGPGAEYLPTSARSVFLDVVVEHAQAARVVVEAGGPHVGHVDLAPHALANQKGRASSWS